MSQWGEASLWVKLRNNFTIQRKIKQNWFSMEFMLLQTTRNCSLICSIRTAYLSSDLSSVLASGRRVRSSLARVAFSGRGAESCSSLFWLWAGRGSGTPTQARGLADPRQRIIRTRLKTETVRHPLALSWNLIRVQLNRTKSDSPTARPNWRNFCLQGGINWLKWRHTHTHTHWAQLLASRVGVSDL